MSVESLYVVWSPVRNSTSSTYSTVECAREEARRLATLHQHTEFYVLRAVESVTYRTDPFVCKNFCK